MNGPDASAVHQYEALRRKLLDTSLRSRMISYRPAKASGIEFLPKEPSSLFRLFCTDGRSFTFTGQPDPPLRRGVMADQGLFAESPEQLEEFEMKARQELGDYLQNPLELDMLQNPEPLADTRLSTPHFNSNLQKRLTKIWRDSKALTEETGLNVLFLAMGSVAWHENPGSEERTAPLLFIPCQLERQANGQFRLKHDGGDLGSNLAFAVMAKETFGLELPEWQDEESAPAYFALVEEAVKRMQGWRIDPSFAALGFFQFTKLVMYEDLDPARWPQDSSPTHHPDVAALLGSGYGPAYKPTPEGADIDALRPVESSFEVYDCDSSQAQAILTAQSGASMLIEGPPGTGKSQTIANLIAEFVASGKTVLFVSEKLAALEVVHRRLKEAGLADACLQLHSRGSKRRAFYEELKHTMGLQRSYQGPGHTFARLSQVRSDLNSYYSSVSRPVASFGLSPFDALGELLALQGQSSTGQGKSVEFSQLAHLAWHQLKAAEPVLEGLDQQITQSGAPSQHPFFGAKITLVTQTDLQRVRGELTSCQSLEGEARSKTAALAKRLGVACPTNHASVALLAKCARLAADAPKAPSLNLADSDWERRRAEIQQAISSLIEVQRIKSQREGQVKQEAWTARWGETAEAYERWADKWHKFLSPLWHRESSRLARALTPSGPTSPEEQEALLSDLIKWQNTSRALTQAQPLLSSLYGSSWQGEFTSPQEVQALLDWALQVRSEALTGAIPSEFLEGLGRGFETEGLLEEALEAVRAAKRLDEGLASLSESLAYDHKRLERLDTAQLASQLDSWSAALPRLPEMAKLNVLTQELAGSGLASLEPLVHQWTPQQGSMRTSLLCAYLEGVLRTAWQTAPPLASFDRVVHEQKVREFRELDSLALSHNRARVIATHLRGLPNWDLGLGSLGLLRRQTELKRGHKPVRWAMERAGEAVQKMKPVLLMSPLSVAQFLPPGTVSFDAVIFDEASQIKPEDALCSIIRSRQTIVVGDSRQMPPTSFFDRLVYLEDEEAPDDVQTIAGIESILALMASATRGTQRTRELSWHYRSLHPSLIEPSNQAFYRGSLVVFPTTGKDDSLGLKLRHDPESVYDRGKSRTNLKEAETVAKAAFDHAQTRPNESLGIAAFSKTQQEAIQDALDRLRKEAPGVLESLDTNHPFEPLFVKNLETVQGDERDVIFVSIGYGKDADGKLTMNFGPINAEGGERRLNVLMTRARRRCEIFTSLTSSDIRLQEGSGEGLAVLKDFLAHAEGQPLASGGRSNSKIGGRIASFLASRLANHEVTAEEGIGGGSFSLDLTLKGRKAGSEDVLGVELDGGSCRQAQSCRDREKLRLDALTKRGWRLERAWTPDLWKDPASEVERLAAALQADGSVLTETEEAETDFVELLTASPPPVTTMASLPEYTAWDGPMSLPPGGLADLDPQQMAALIWEATAIEGPIHQDLLLLRLRASSGAARAGARIQSAFGWGLDYALKRGPLMAQGAFVMLPEQASRPARSRAKRPAGERKAHWVPPHELEVSMEKTVAGSLGITADQAALASWKLLGFQRTSPEMLQLASLAIEKLCRTGRLTKTGDLLSIPEAPPRQA